jgi:apolipoprotein N-acyltransferase
MSRKDLARDLVAWLLSFSAWAAAFHPLDLWPLAWIALVPGLVRTASGPAGRRRLGLVWVIGQFGLHAALMSWAGVIAVPLVFLTPILGIPFSWLTGFLLERGIVRLRLPLIAVAPLAIVLVEVLRDQALLGLSWASIGYSQWRWLDLVQLASAGRVHLVSLPVLFANAAIATVILRARAGAPWGARLRPLALGALVVAAAAGGGSLLRPGDFAEGPLAAGLQPNVSQKERARIRGTDNLRIHHEILKDFRARNPGTRLDLLVYSETSFPMTREPTHQLGPALRNGSVPAAPGIAEIPFRDFVLQEPDQVTILGLLRGRDLPHGERNGPRDDDGDGLDETNVAWVVRGGVPTDAVYEKRGLAPFGEFTPLPRWMPGREKVKGLIKSSVGYVPGLNPGREPVVFEAASPSGPRKGSLTICFEMVLPWYFREGVALGADFHVNISNDAWFDGSSELELVDVAGIFRAVESGRALFRVSNSGISTLIAPDGARLAQVAAEDGRRTQVRGSFHGRIPIGRGRTGYVRYGDLPWILPALLLLGMLLVATIRAKRILPGASLR